MLNWFRRYFAALGRGLPPGRAAEVTILGVRTGLQAAFAVVVAAGAGLLSADVWVGAAIAGLAALAAFVMNALGK